MVLKPLEQWYCDRCGEVIEKPEDGWLHWRREGEPPEWKVYSIEILHHARASPLGEGGCYPARMEHDHHLRRFLGPAGIVQLLSMMDVGAFHDPEGRELAAVKDVRNWVEVFRRLHVPYYEEARRYFDEARSDGTLDGIDPYLEPILHRLVKKYGDGADKDGILIPTRKNIDLNDPLALTVESVRELLAGGDDRKSNSLRVTKGGIAYLHVNSKPSSDNLEEVAFRLETFDAGNGYVGRGAANDDKFVLRVYNVLRRNWPTPEDSYIDVW